MTLSFVFARRLTACSKRTSLFLNLAAALLVAAAGAHAQFGAPAPGTQVHDPAALKPPAGARVALVEFEDMECPDCGRANPLLREAAAKYKIPLVRHDFPLPMHAWSFNAAVNARWFDTRGKALGDEYRDQVFANQASIVSPDVLLEFTQKFAVTHGLALPFAIDPQGKLAELVKADYALGQRVGIEHTPTIWVVTANSKGAPFVEVVDRSKLYQLIDQAFADTHSAPVNALQPATATERAGATAPGSKKITSPSKLTLTEGSWSGKSDRGGIIAFSVTNNTVSGDGTVPVFFTCNVPREVHSLPGGIQASGAVGLESMQGSPTVDFSKRAHATGPNSFVATLAVALTRAKYTVVVKGKFLSESLAKGSITVTSSTCKNPMVYTWEAAP